jgi:hypothetical protein
MFVPTLDSKINLGGKILQKADVDKPHFYNNQCTCQ